MSNMTPEGGTSIQDGEPRGDGDGLDTAEQQAAAEAVIGAAYRR